MQPIDLIPNVQKWRIGNCHIAIDTLIAIIMAQRQNFPSRVGRMYHKEYM